MNKQMIESKVLDIVKGVTQGAYVEDSWVELKSVWPTDHSKAARQLGGQANAAQGQPILWVIGLDEKARSITGAQEKELADWHAQLIKQFDGVCPELLHNLWIPTETRGVVALVFETDRAPYVINIESGKREVPWRSANSTRSAFRRELLGLLSAVQSVPEFEIVSCRMNMSAGNRDTASDTWMFEINMNLYASLDMRQSVVVPFHRCHCWLEVDAILPRVECEKTILAPPHVQRGYIGRDIIRAVTEPLEHDSLTIGATASEVIISGPGALNLWALSQSHVVSRPVAGHDARVEVTLGLAMQGREVNLIAPLKYGSCNSDASHTWVLVRESRLQGEKPML